MLHISDNRDIKTSLQSIYAHLTMYNSKNRGSTDKIWQTRSWIAILSELCEKNKNTHGTPTYVNRQNSPNCLSIHVRHSAQTLIKRWWSAPSRRLACWKKRGNGWLLTLFILHGTMPMASRCATRWKQRGNEQRWLAWRKSLPHIITLDYTSQWRLDAVRGLESRQEAFTESI